VRNATLLTVGSSLLAVFIVAACASSEQAVPQQQQQQEPEPTDDTPPPSTTPQKPAPKGDASTGTPAKQCVAKCTSDLECENSCPAAPAGVNCCDVSTGACYANSNSSCPKTSDDGGTTPAY